MTANCDLKKILTLFLCNNKVYLSFCFNLLILHKYLSELKNIRIVSLIVEAAVTSFTWKCLI